ncbi:MAG TPA: hypothetical protein VIN09_06345 [Chloroflexota bacterium]
MTTIPFLLNSDDFVFDSEVIAQAAAFRFRVAEIGVPTRYFPEASSVNFWRGLVYGLSTLAVVVRFLLDRLGLRPDPQFRWTLDEVVARGVGREAGGASLPTSTSKRR